MLFTKVLHLCPKRLQTRFWWLFAGMLLLALGETATVGLLAFYAATVSDPQASFQALTNHFLSHWLPFSATEIIGSPKRLIGILSLLLICSIMAKNLFRGAILYQTARFGALVEACFGKLMLTGILQRNYLWHLKQNSADLTQLVHWRSFVGRSFFTSYLNVLCELCMLVVLLAALLCIQPVISLLFITLQGGAGYVVYRTLRNKLNHSSKQCHQCDLEINRNVHRAIHGVKDVKITDTAHFFIQLFSRKATEYAHIAGWQRFWQETPLLALETMGFFLIAGAIVFMLFILDFSPLETTGTTAMLAVTAWRTLPAFNRILSAFTHIQSSRPYVDSVLNALPTEIPRKKRLEIRESLLPFTREIALRNVAFSYEKDKPVLTSFNLTITKGQSLGIMGPSGCGKSTLVDLLTGLLPPQQGEIRIDGVALTQDTTAYWQRQIGYVPQFSYIFDGTLAENIAFGQAIDTIDQERIHTSCSMAAIDFLDRLPDGIHSLIGERGIRLSGGQRQRVAIARALYRNPDIIIFDEATSALDEDNDQQIRQLIVGLKGKHTMIIVSHRPSTVQDCDKIIHMTAEQTQATDQD